MIDTETVEIVCKALHNEAPKCLKKLFHNLSDMQNRELRSAKADLHIPMLAHSWDRKALPAKEYVYGTTLYRTQKQGYRSPPLKQN